MKQYTQILADYLSELQYDDIPAEVIERAKLLTLHVIGVTMSVTPGKIARGITHMAKELGAGSKTATIIGEGSKVSPANAALANGTMADLLDWEDCSWTGHPSAGAVPAALAMAEAYHRSGKEYLTALVGGYDVYQRVAMAVQPTPERFNKGWGLYCWQIFAPTAIAAKLYGLKGKKMNQVLGTAAAMTPVATNQVNRSFSDFYHYTHGLTAKLGIECTEIVDIGISTLMNALEDYGGYWPGVSDQCDWDWLDKDLGERFLIMDTLFKHWPANMWIQVPLDMLDQLIKRHSINIDEIEKIEVSPFIPRRSEPAPEEGFTELGLVKAQFCIPFCCAMYLKGPKPGWEWTEEKYLNDPEIMEWAKKVVGVGEESLIPHNFQKFRDGSFPQYGMKIIMKDGTEYETAMQFPKGHPQNPYTREECIETFKLATKGIISDQRADEIIDLCLNKVESLGDMAAIGDLLKADL